MKILVLIKQVPDTWSERKMDPATGRVDRSANEPVIDEICERALEAALRYKDDHDDAEVVVMAMGPVEAKEMLRKALATGADSAVHVLDDGLVGSDMGRTCAVLAAAARHIGFDLIVAGNESTDGRGGVLPAMLAERLGIAQATYLDSLQVGPASVVGQRTIPNATMTVRAPIPAIVSVTEQMPEARFANFKGIMRAKKKPFTVLTLRDLHGAAAPAGASSVVRSVTVTAARGAGSKIVDRGDAGTLLADFLVAGSRI